jgi:hypothetical protein
VGKSILRVAFWASFGAGAFVLSRLFRWQRTIDAGAVSDEWLADQRGTNEPTPF